MGGGAGRGGATGTGGGGTTGTAGTTGGGGAAALPFSYYIGADITNVETQADASRASLLTLMKAHGFNYVRLRTFVDPKAADGYDKTNGTDDIAHTVAFGKQVKDAGMGLLVDFHYSDNWADPGKQCVPVAWQGFTTIAQMATAVHDYTQDAITKLIAGGARPDMVQIGNESTPGILIHLCDSAGHPLAGTAGYNAVNGALYLYSSTDGGAPPAGGPPAGGWANLGMLLAAGVKGVKDVDTGIVISLHLDRGNDLASSRNYIMNAMSRGVAFDVFGESCYTNTQGQPSDWTNTFTSLATQFPNLKFMIAEYSGSQRAANDVMWNMPNNRGLGTFNWQPSTLWTRSGSTWTAGTDMAIYDQMKIDYASRL
jgi:arabinogalactan endo-1,4-beta-galactosidase